MERWRGRTGEGEGGGKGGKVGRVKGRRKFMLICGNMLILLPVIKKNLVGEQRNMYINLTT